MITNSILNNNAAEESGGAIFNFFGHLTITGSTLTENTAQETGGVINNGDSELTITCSVLNNNAAEESGGAIYFGELGGKYESENCTFKGNKPDDVYRDSKTNYFHPIC